MIQFRAPLQGDWLEPDPAGELRTAPVVFRAPIHVDERDLDWQVAASANTRAPEPCMTPLNAPGCCGWAPDSHFVFHGERAILTGDPADSVRNRAGVSLSIVPSTNQAPPAAPTMTQQAADGYVYWSPAPLPENLDEMRTAITTAESELATGYAIGNRALTAEQRAERAATATPPNWAAGMEIVEDPNIPPGVILAMDRGTRISALGTDLAHMPARLSYTPNDQFIAEMAEARRTDTCRRCGQPGHLNCPEPAADVRAAVESAARTADPLALAQGTASPADETPRREEYAPVRFAAPVITDRDGNAVAPKLAAKREMLMASVRAYAAADPRTLQAAIGPSEIGDPCDARVLRKLLGFPAVNQPDPWASFVGTAVHAKLAEVFEAVNMSIGRERFLLERRVWVSDDISGSTDLADVEWTEATETSPGSGIVDIYDHKVLGTDSFRTVKAEKLAPGSKYGVQIDSYALGWQRAGYEVRSVNLALWPRSGFLDGLLVIERKPDFANATAALARLDMLRDVGTRVDAATRDEPWIGTEEAGPAIILTTPGKGCGFCPFYAPLAPLTRFSCDRGREYQAAAKRGTGPRGVTP
jgi:hypothetical protein